MSRIDNLKAVEGFTIRGADDWLAYMTDAAGTWFYLSTEVAREWRLVPGYNQAAYVTENTGEDTIDALHTDVNVAIVAFHMLRAGHSPTPLAAMYWEGGDDLAQAIADLDARYVCFRGPRERKARAKRDDTFKAVQASVRAMGLTVRKREGEFRVNYANGREETAYYTNDAEDAVNTARAMRDFAERKL